jgi:hypothetical protein
MYLRSKPNYMKKSITIIAILSFILMGARAQEMTEKENALLDNFLKAKVTGEKEKVVSDTLDRVIPGPVYKLKAGFSDPDGTSYCSQYYFVIKDGNLVDFGTSNLMPVLKSGLSIKTEADAKVFETALDKVFPVSWSDEDVKKHIKKGNKWYFVRGDFFDFYSGFIITVDPAGKIIATGYDMKATEK